MRHHNKSNIRLFLESFVPELPSAISPTQAHYLLHVMRLRHGYFIKVFNCSNGEFYARLEQRKDGVFVIPTECIRPSESPNPPTWLAFSPIKPHLTHFIIEKATELGVSDMQLFFSDFTQIREVNVPKLRAIAIEASEQCERLSIPCIREPLKLSSFLENLPNVHWFAAVERNENAVPIYALVEPAGIIIGPEGGFSEHEKFILSSHTQTVSLGANILRSETAAICALSRLRNIVHW
jgi:16S rRNA (uracil1498-N3)-methyltransferase